MVRSIKGGTRRRAFGLRRTLGLLSGVAVLAGIGCSDNDNLVGVISSGIVTTFKDSNFNFTTLHTFAMPDTVAHLVPITGTPLPITGQFDAVALNQVRADLLARGYTGRQQHPGRHSRFRRLVGVTATDKLGRIRHLPMVQLGILACFQFLYAGVQLGVGHHFPVGSGDRRDRV
jgi:hypothetical protein